MRPSSTGAQARLTYVPSCNNVPLIVKTRPGSYVLAALFVVIGSSISLNVMPKFQNIFQTMLKGRPLPRLTQIVIAHAPWSILLISIGLAVLVIVKDRLKWGPPNAIFALALFLGCGLVVVAIMLPLCVIINRLQTLSHRQNRRTIRLPFEKRVGVNALHLGDHPIRATNLSNHSAIAPAPASN